MSNLTDTVIATFHAIGKGLGAATRKLKALRAQFMEEYPKAKAIGAQAARDALQAVAEGLAESYECQAKPSAKGGWTFVDADDTDVPAARMAWLRNVAQVANAIDEGRDPAATKAERKAANEKAAPTLTVKAIKAAIDGFSAKDVKAILTHCQSILS